MIVYLETSFLLDIGLKQEGFQGAMDLLHLGHASAVELVLPSFSVLEAIHTGHAHQRRRSRLFDKVKSEFVQLGRSQLDAASTAAVNNALGHLTDLSGEIVTEVQVKVIEALKTVRVLQVDGAILAAAMSQQKKLALSVPDSIIFASILFDLARPENGAKPKALMSRDRAFVNKVHAELRQVGCKWFVGYQELHAFLKNAGV